MGVKLTIDDDFKYLLHQLGEDAPETAEKAVRESGRILLESLREEVTNSQELSERQKRLFLNNLDEKYLRLENGAVGEVGWLFEKWDLDNPSTGVLAILAEFGTKERLNRGYLSPAYFTTKARKKSARTIKQKQETIINEAFEKLKGNENG